MTYASAGALLACAVLGWRYVARARRMLHLLQLEHYENARLFVWLRRREELADGAALSAVSVIVCGALALVRNSPVELIVWLVLCAVLVAVWRREPRRADITPLVFTERARRLFVGALLVPAVGVLLGVVLALALGSDVPLALAALVLAVCTLACPWLVTGANAALAPVQRHINRRFEESARATLASVAPVVVGITGSYGKTTTKVCVGAVLAEHDPTLITPASFNSYLGVIRTINEHLQAAHRNFVVEMGMYRAGDIAELCELVRPQIGVLTAIGPVHLERMGTIEAIADAKAELALALPPDGRLVANGDDPRCREIASRVSVDTVLYAIEHPDAHVRAENIVLADGRTHFELVIGGERVAVSSGLLGRHNVSNLLAAAAVGHLRGLSSAEIARGLAGITPPEHRLQPVPNPRAGIVVIDDAYNSNPAGAAAALEVLHSHPAKRRILVTPGMVELGDQEAELNEAFGRQAAAACDHVILVGRQRTRPIDRGLRAAGFSPEAITVVRDIAEVTAVLARFTRAGDVVLFENDLPDMYSEPDSPAPAAPPMVAGAA
ncbi:MAG TPA: UDP-N-acetylmuramoyl-tripeptide--D-alanyl-D-alanine ligase [Solirubrobacteraceae bacterium]|nr:UDP-N-acetylmuramoyl-tripeptide--D-alanyl-D-alanine ligase [Solirubrobacteraceae bacterium]